MRISRDFGTESIQFEAIEAKIYLKILFNKKST